jgi:hypothetical protein
MQKQKTLNGEKVTANIDWLTMTTKNDTLGTTWYEEFVKRVRANGGGGVNFRRLVKYSQRLGFTMEDFEGFSWGYSEHHNRYIVILRGAVAHNFWRRVILPSQVRVTRIDFAVTVELKSPQDLVGKAYEKLERDGIPEGVKTRKFTKITTYSGGATLYVGSRTSDFFGRLYDKGAQLGNMENVSWRYEVEVHKPKASSMASQLYDRLQQSHPKTQEYNAIATFVHQWFGARGITPVWAMKEGLDVLAAQHEIAIKTPKRRLAWLRTQVAPTVDDLIKLGLGRQVVEALGMDLGQLELLLPRPNLNNKK